MTFERLNPVTGEVASTARAMTVAEAEAVAEAVAERADAAFPAWSSLGSGAQVTSIALRFPAPA